MIKKLNNTCMNEFDPDALDEVGAIKKIINSIKSSTKHENIEISKSLGRVISRDIKSTLNIPNFKNSAMDGYAINIRLLKSNKYVMRQKGVSLAGKPYTKELLNNETIKVMTGSVIPENCDAVIMKEMVDVEGTSIYFQKNIP